jgi:hypothetical protein
MVKVGKAKSPALAARVRRPAVCKAKSPALAARVRRPAGQPRTFRFKCEKCDFIARSKNSRVARSTRDRHRREAHGVARTDIVKHRRTQSARYMTSSRVTHDENKDSTGEVAAADVLVLILCVQGSCVGFLKTFSWWPAYVSTYMSHIWPWCGLS